MSETPRYGHLPVKMRRVADWDAIDHVGDFAWTNHGDRHIMIALPTPIPALPESYTINSIPVREGPNSPGKYWGWDGNEDAPTLTPSLHCLGQWHGSVVGGILVES